MPSRPNNPAKAPLFILERSRHAIEKYIQRVPHFEGVTPAELRKYNTVLRDEDVEGFYGVPIVAKELGLAYEIGVLPRDLSLPIDLKKSVAFYEVNLHAFYCSISQGLFGNRKCIQFFT